MKQSICQHYKCFRCSALRKVASLIGTVTLVLLVTSITQAQPVASDLSLWLRADAGITSDATGRVSTWTDQSGANHHASQSTGNKRPQLVSEGLNGRPIVRFDGQNDLLHLSGQVLTSQTFSIFAVINDTRASSDGSLREIFSNWTPSNSDTSVFFGTLRTNPVRARLSDDFGAHAGVGALTNPATHFIFTGISSATDAFIYQGETLLAAKGAPLSTRNLSTPYVIGNQGDTIFEYWQGDIVELLVYNRELSVEEQQHNWAYLHNKYFGPSVAVLFEDNFDTGTWHTAWVSKLCCQVVENGALHVEDTDGWPRDALATVHDSDPTWTDYTVSLTAAFIEGTPWEHFNIVLRTDGFERGSGVSQGTAYQLEFLGQAGWLPSEANRIVLTRTDHETPSWVTLYDQQWTPLDSPMAITVSIIGARIRLRINNRQIFDVEDPNPLPFGGVGLHTIWEAAARFDDVVVRTSRLGVDFPCDGLQGTIVGTDGNDVLLGTAGNDVVVGLGGDDVIYGFAGHDAICGGPGNDLIWGGSGRDRLFGEVGDDLLWGGDGADRLVGGPGRDVLAGGAGNDQIVGEEGDDVLHGGYGVDRLVGGPGRDILFGGPGNDRLSGGPDPDYLQGGADDDALSGGSGSDVCAGGSQRTADTADASCEIVHSVP